ncbi:MAG: hypothetical protein QM775_02295 [Pirellulales bacterium]
MSTTRYAYPITAAAIGRFTQDALLRAWIGFVVTAWLGLAAMWYFDGDNLLRSDDSYIAGFFCGAFAAAAAVVYTLLERLTSSRLKASLSYFALVAAWCASLILLTMNAPEARELGPLGAVVHGVTGFVAWLCFLRTPHRGVLLVASFFGLLFIGLYAYVDWQMSVRRSELFRSQVTETSHDSALARRSVAARDLPVSPSGARGG